VVLRRCQRRGIQTVCRSATTTTLPNLGEVRAWATAHGIDLRGVRKDSNALYNNEYDPAVDDVPLEAVADVANAYVGLRVLPPSLLEIMRGQTIYFSLAPGRSYAVLKGNYGGVLLGVNDGIILEQPIRTNTAVHEFGHIVGYDGIEATYDMQFPSLHALDAEYRILFDTTAVPPFTRDPPPGYISTYSTVNRAECFAEHFSHYVLQGPYFRERAAHEPLLRQRYDFLAMHLFAGREY
jgi:hypothetical protein